MRGHRLLFALALVLTVALAGCPGDDGGSGYARTDEVGEPVPPSSSSSPDDAGPGGTDEVAEDLTDPRAFLSTRSGPS